MSGKKKNKKNIHTKKTTNQKKAPSEIKFTMKLLIFGGGRNVSVYLLEIINIFPYFPHFNSEGVRDLAPSFSCDPKTQVTVSSACAPQFYPVSPVKIFQSAISPVQPSSELCCLPQCFIFPTFILQTGRSHKTQGLNPSCLCHQCYLPLEEFCWKRVRK